MEKDYKGPKTLKELKLQLLLDKHVYYYMVSKNMHTAAEAFAKETHLLFDKVPNIGGDGYLSDWWSTFWDIHSSRPGINPAANQASSSTSQESSSLTFQSQESSSLTFQSQESSASNAHVDLPAHDHINTVQNIHPPMRRPRRPNLQRQAPNAHPVLPAPDHNQQPEAVNPTTVLQGSLEPASSAGFRTAFDRALNAQNWYPYEETYHSSCTKNANNSKHK